MPAPDEYPPVMRVEYNRFRPRQRLPHPTPNPTSAPRSNLPRPNNVPDIFNMPLRASVNTYQDYRGRGARFTVNNLWRSMDPVEQALVEDLQIAFRLAKQPVPPTEVLLFSKDEAKDYGQGAITLMDAFVDWWADRGPELLNLEAWVGDKPSTNGTHVAEDAEGEVISDAVREALRDAGREAAREALRDVEGDIVRDAVVEALREVRRDAEQEREPRAGSEPGPGNGLQG